jgi:hypothetical protein
MEGPRTIGPYFFMSLVSGAIAELEDVVEDVSVFESEQPTMEARTQTARQERIRFFIFLLGLFFVGKDAFRVRGGTYALEANASRARHLLH